MSRVSWIALVLLVSSVQALAADIYRWVDANGRTQYGTAPPPGVKATLVRPPPPADPQAASQAAARAQRSIAETERSSAERAAEAARREAEAAAAGSGAADRLRRCAEAREQLLVVTRPQAVFKFDASGGRVDLTDAARQSEITRLRGDVATLCAGLDSAAALRQVLQDMSAFLACVRAKERLQGLEQGPAHVPQWELDQARQLVKESCAAGRFPPGTGTRGEWFTQFQR